jgi:hypothetical protein
MTRAILCLWDCTIAVALLFFIRGCAERGPVLVVKVEVPRLEFTEK